ncbi:hypothetical protein MAPG_07338 [Magnaporthiopsis poae ATCC 64411]|uniref:Uncharacterized protein n=1 Tax=Magnaporthiopsis poae (strain ATCC 64411 / 73-15) TaxID=644358 RepID=A0A0C4E4E5_MAGP6|nr:hypothetical protein MAPG_07338 [Magnaporthiopsis poae ATCC 64411]
MQQTLLGLASGKQADCGADWHYGPKNPEPALAWWFSIVGRASFIGQSILLLSTRLRITVWKGVRRPGSRQSGLRGPSLRM